MTLFDLLIVTFLCLQGYGKTVAECMSVTGLPRELAEQAAETVIQILDLDCRISPAADLWKGATNLPVSRQYSLKLLKEAITPKALMHAALRVYRLLNGYGKYSSLPGLDKEDVLPLYKYVEPVALLLGITYTEEDIIAGYEEAMESETFAPITKKLNMV